MKSNRFGVRGVTGTSNDDWSFLLVCKVVVYVLSASTTDKLSSVDNWCDVADAESQLKENPGRELVIATRLPPGFLDEIGRWRLLGVITGKSLFC